jgi:hypothetical protein
MDQYVALDVSPPWDSQRMSHTHTSIEAQPCETNEKERFTLSIILEIDKSSLADQGNWFNVAYSYLSMIRIVYLR